jgi:DNA polymerase III subunit epsilon
VKHGALLDAELLAHLYIEMTGGRQIGLGLGAAAAPSMAAPSANTPAATPRAFREPRPHAASAAELERHAAFVRTLKEPLWLSGA